jgi:tetratricopeptide (TPR) repeat protein
MSFHRRQWEDLRRYARKAAAINPLQGYVHILLGYAREAEVESWGPEEVEYVLDECRRAVALEPRDGSLWRSYADMTLKLYGREVLTWDDPVQEEKYRREAVEAYRGTLATDPRGSRALIAFLTGAVPDPLFLMEVTAGSEPPVLTELVFQFLKKGRWERAAEAYWETASGSSSRRSYYLAAAEGHRRMKLHSKAAGVLRDWVDGFPDDADALYHLGRILERLGDGEGARRQFGRALSLSPGNSTYREALEGK